MNILQKPKRLKKQKKKFGGNADLYKQYTDTVNPFPASFTLKVKESKNYDTIVKEIESFEGVKSIKTPVSTKDLINAERNYIRNII